MRASDSCSSSVGAHVDNYDVFLLQGSGTREWSIEGEPRASGDEALVAGLDVRVLSRFESSVTCELKPGDALYLPPRYAHEGISTSKDCLSYSVGFRAPSAAELLTSLASHVSATNTVLSEEVRYTDADLVFDPSGGGRGSVDAYAVEKVKGLVRQAVEGLLSHRMSTVGRNLTRL